MRKLCTFLLLTISVNAFSQDWPVKKLVMNKKAVKVPFTKVTPFSFIANKPLAKQGTYQLLELSPSFNNQLMQQRPEALQLTIPLNGSKSITCDLVQFSIGIIKYTENNDVVPANIKVPVTYIGIISGEKNKNTVTLTVNDDYLSLSAINGSNEIMITNADEKDNAVYRLYDNSKIQFLSPAPLNCGTDQNKVSAVAKRMDLTGGSNPTAVEDKCVNVFVDCFDSLYTSRFNSKQATINYVYELFNLVITGYYNEKVNIQVTTINVWTTKDPFRGDTRENALFDLASYWKDNFWGNIMVGLDFGSTGRSGLADAIGKVKGVAANTCPAYNASDTTSAICYCDLNYGGNYSSFPTGPNTTQSQLYLVMHEMGHLLGSSHTHWCGWKLTSNPDTFGAIDSCATPEGTCPKGPPPPGGVGTIMSYCVTGSLSVNYNNGFGTLPGNAVRTFIDQNACILNCSDCFGLLNINNGSGNEYAFRPAGTKNQTGNTGKGQTKKQAEKKPAIIPKKLKQ